MASEDSTITCKVGGGYPLPTLSNNIVNFIDLINDNSLVTIIDENIFERSIVKIRNCLRNPSSGKNDKDLYLALILLKILPENRINEINDICIKLMKIDLELNNINSSYQNLYYENIHGNKRLISILFSLIEDNIMPILLKVEERIREIEPNYGSYV